ncbi:aminotransferase class I/II-fold pyridoxal phosphate-dependent enzyme [Sodalis glossinidius]|uniref:aminotransferase class I/II-fold pyridoxal phosphate-dependent enzyme n=1 Tax=Sodalis glossinidius TaxID=63612 RepID=UPI0003110A4C|nr:aminotransferase class I/II-fold pyridoxal phosphate-dependent enzyme [Sodalis glossinidius]
MPAHAIHDQLSTRLRALQPSVTLVISQLARKLTAEGRDIINMSSGELDFDMPEPIVREAIATLHDGQTRYTDVGGNPALKAAIIAKFRRENQLEFTPRQIIASTAAPSRSFLMRC